MEVCQDGIDGVIPAWCVPYDFGIDTIFQLALELLFLVILFMFSYFYFEWKKRRKQERKKLDEMKNNDEWHLSSITTVKYKDK